MTFVAFLLGVCLGLALAAGCFYVLWRVLWDADRSVTR